MTRGKFITNVIIAALGLSLLFLIYRFFIKTANEPSSSPNLVAVGTAQNRVDETTDEFLNILLSLQKIELRGEIFATPFFKSLQDFSTPLPEETPGRANPFAPLGIGGAPAPNGAPAGTSTPATTTSGRSTAPPPAGSGHSLRDQLLDALNQH